MPKNRRISPAQRRREEQQLQPGASALLSMTVPQPRWTEPTPAPTRPALGRTRTRIVHDEFSGKSRRERERQAREYAERWYQALRTWQVWVTREEDVPRRERGTGEGRMRPVVGNWASRPLVVQERELVTPWRQLPEWRAAQLVNADDTLTRIRDGRTLATLVDPRGGWHPSRMMAIIYAHAVLTLAYHLGDLKALEHSKSVPNER